MTKHITPLKSVNGYILFCTGLHEELTEEKIDDLFSEYGTVKSIKVNLDRKTGSLKGYALIEYEDLTEAKDAISELNGTKFYGNEIHVDFAFKDINTSKPK